jgi:hypothetical protein
MLESISWSDFILALVAAAAVYYTTILLLFYSRDLLQLLRSRNAHAEQSNPEPLETEEVNLIGDTRTTPLTDDAEDQRIDESSQIISGEEDVQEDTMWDSDPIVTNPLHRSFSQLVEEVNALAYIITQNSKEEVSLLFETLLSRYPQLAKAHYQASINQFIIEACEQYGQMKLTHADIDGWWAHALTSNQHS